MYDIFGSSGDQLKIFPEPLFYFSEEKAAKNIKMLGFTGGSLNHYGIGAPVPWKAMSYKYSPYFIVIDIDVIPDCPDYTGAIVYVFSAGKLAEIYDDIDSVPESCFALHPLVIDSEGDRVTGVDSKDGLRRYIDKITAEERERTTFMKSYAKKQRELIDKFQNGIIDGNALNSSQLDLMAETVKEMDEIEKRHGIDKYKAVADSKEQVMQMYGAYLELAIKFMGNKNAEKRNNALQKEASKFVNDASCGINEYLDWYEPDKAEKAKITKADEWIRSYASYKE